MNTSRIKSYAPQARREFVQSVTSKANILGLSERNIHPAEVKGDVAIINGRPYPKKIEDLRQRIIQRINREGFQNVMESVAYTWFNRFMALRYMELHDYLDHGYRVLSNTSGSDTPEMLERAGDIDLPGLNKEKAIELRLAGNKDNELYQMLIVAQCNALHRAMPFLFERIDDETELLMPENLLHSNSPVRKMVSEIDEEDWKEVEIVGWIYQFYISEKKDELMKAKKPYKPEEIPAVTQLFTPNWIVKYLVENSLGRTWIATYPDSQIKQKMEYYIDPAEQEPEVQKQLEEITPKELNPEQITVLDPACGSGHILVEAYNIFKEIYLERGYRTRDIPRIILEKNLYGLEIDDRATQLAGFALLMKARADDRRILTEPPNLTILSIQGSENINAENIADALLGKESRTLLETNNQEVQTEHQTKDVGKQDIVDLIELFKLGQTVGSLITVPEEIQKKLPKIEELVNTIIQSGDMYSRAVARTLDIYIKQSKLLSKNYDCVIANPPYMGSKLYNQSLKEYASQSYKMVRYDLYGMFIKRNIEATKINGHVGMITIPNWMFLSYFERLRSIIIHGCYISGLIHNGRGVFGSDFGSCSFILNKYPLKKAKGVFKRLFDKSSSVLSNQELVQRFFNVSSYFVSSVDIMKIPSAPISYWVTPKVRSIFKNLQKINDIAEPRQGLATADNDRFLRRWHEVSIGKVGFGFGSNSQAKKSLMKWFPYNKGGIFRKWYGNWLNDGEDIRKDKLEKLSLGLCLLSNSKPKNTSYYFRESVSWSKVTIGDFSVRYYPQGFIFDVAGCSIFASHKIINQLSCLLNSKIVSSLVSVLSGSVNYEVGNIKSIPVCDLSVIPEHMIFDFIQKSKIDWNSFETSWDFKRFPWISDSLKSSTSEESFNSWKNHSIEQTRKMKELEEENNRIFIEAYGLEDELTPEVPEEQITLTVNPKYRYGANYSEEEFWNRFRLDSIKELISYSIGCMMGRYSLDEPGLIYAHSDNEGFDSSKYKSFPADDDGIIPVMDMGWFSDDASNRFIEFLKVVWLEGTLENNLQFMAESLGKKKGETPIETIRRYISNDFYKDHLKTYKKRPIYWLFSSGRNKAFECLVYLHRYNEATLSRMRGEYVTPLQGKLSSRIEYLNNEIEHVESTSSKKKLEKESSEIKKKQEELRKFDEELRHYADMRIKLDLDYGVKVNYDKFGNLLAETKAVTGK